MQGVWISISATPLERPAALRDRPSLTDEEVVELQQRADRIFKSGNSDFAAGDGVFLAALENRQVFKSVTSTHGSEDMVDREFDHHTSLIVDPADGHIPALTTEARQRQAAAATVGRRLAGPEDLNNALRCLSWSVPRLGGRYGAGDLAYYQIFQTPGYVVLYLEVGHEARIIPLDGRPHLPTSVRQWSGDSRGRWEGATLVVETTNFSAKSNFMGAAEGLHLVERFTRIADDRINYEMTIDDATTWTRPWTAEMPLKQSPVRIYDTPVMRAMPRWSAACCWALAPTNGLRKPRRNRNKHKARFEQACSAGRLPSPTAGCAEPSDRCSADPDISTNGDE